MGKKNQKEYELKTAKRKQLTHTMNSITKIRYTLLLK